MTCQWLSVCHLVFKLLPSSSYQKLPQRPFISRIWQKATDFQQFFVNFSQAEPSFQENLPKRTSFKNSGPNKPIHMGSTYLYT